MMIALDDAIGNVTDAIEANGLADNLVLVWTSDNGAPAGPTFTAIGGSVSLFLVSECVPDSSLSLSVRKERASRGIAVLLVPLLSSCCCHLCCLRVFLGAEHPGEIETPPALQRAEPPALHHP